jgi:hypothetical protein
LVGCDRFAQPWPLSVQKEPMEWESFGFICYTAVASSGAIIVVERFESLL